MSRIEYPTGNNHIDWLLKNENNALNEEGVTSAIRFLIDRYNDLVDDSEETLSGKQ